MILSQAGQLAQRAWTDLPNHFPHARLDAFCLMPNHVHGIILIIDIGVEQLHPLSDIVKAFKSFSARRINLLRRTPGVPVWQRNYYERIVRNEREWQVIRDYIIDNPRRWDEDSENPAFLR
jgi:REP element-mobilizing transposase RayT